MGAGLRGWRQHLPEQLARNDRTRGPGRSEVPTGKLSTVTEDRSDLAAAGREIVDSNSYMTLGTADAEGRPWVSPVWFAAVGYAELLWVSVAGDQALAQPRGDGPS